MFFSGRIVNGRHFPCVDVEAVLPLFRETDIEGDHVVRNAVRDEFWKTLLFDAVFVQRRHEVGELAGHSELDFQFSASEYECVLEKYVKSSLK